MLRGYLFTTAKSAERVPSAMKIDALSKMTYNCHTMSILTVRLTEEEKRILEQRSRKAGLKKATFVRQLIRETPFETAEDVLADVEKRLGDKRLRVAR